VTGNLRTRSGWVTSAAVVGLVVGGYNALSGIATVADDDTVAAHAEDVSSRAPGVERVAA